jgi:hypothetical protein
MASVNESFKVLYQAGYLQYADRSGFGGSRSEFVLARVTEQGILAAHIPHSQPEPSSDGRAEAKTVESASVTATGVEKGSEMAEEKTDVALSRASRLIDARPDLSEYERSDLKRKVEDLKEAVLTKDETKVDQIKAWFARYAPWVASELPA